MLWAKQNPGRGTRESRRWSEGCCRKRRKRPCGTVRPTGSILREQPGAGRGRADPGRDPRR